MNYRVFLVSHFTYSEKWYTDTFVQTQAWLMRLLREYWVLASPIRHANTGMAVFICPLSHSVHGCNYRNYLDRNYRSCAGLLLCPGEFYYMPSLINHHHLAFTRSLEGPSLNCLWNWMRSMPALHWKLIPLQPYISDDSAGVF